jgi:glyoxylase-like metal-dependent hydrolase (beta-lactamase superfamily II)/ferredoxin
VADVAKSLPTNVGENFFVDCTCINCDTCRQLAPRSFVETGEYSSVYRQPSNEEEVIQAYQALLACPVGSIGARIPDKPHQKIARESFPIQLEPNVYYNGFNSEKSFGANSYFVCDPGGNWLIDSPRYIKTLVDFFDRAGGIRYIFLTHEDDVADAERYAKHFQAARIIHRADSEAVPGAECILDGRAPIDFAPGFMIIPVPGHTPGSMALLYRDRYLFTGDHMGWDTEVNGLRLPEVYVWHEETLRQSTERLLDYTFEWVLPGHSGRIHLPLDRMKQELRLLLQRRVKASAV